MPYRKPTGDNKAPLTGVGCVLMVLSLAVIVGVGIYMVRWRDSESGHRLRTEHVVWASLLIGASFFGISSVVLRLVGLRVWSEPDNKRIDGEPHAPPDGGCDPGA